MAALGILKRLMAPRKEKPKKRGWTYVNVDREEHHFRDHHAIRLWWRELWRGLAVLTLAAGVSRAASGYETVLQSVKIASITVTIPVSGGSSASGVASTFITSGTIVVSTGSLTVFPGAGWAITGTSATVNSVQLGPYSVSVTSGVLTLAGIPSVFVSSGQLAVTNLTSSAAVYNQAGVPLAVSLSSGNAANPFYVLSTAPPAGILSVYISSGAGVGVNAHALTGTSSVFMSSGSVDVLDIVSAFISSGQVFVSNLGGSAIGVVTTQTFTTNGAITGTVSMYMSSGTVDILDLVSATISSGNVSLTGTSSVFIGSGTVALGAGAADLGTVHLSTMGVLASTSGVIGAISLGSTSGKTEVHKTFFKNTAATAATILGSYTVTTGKTLYVYHADITGVLTTISATGSKIGDTTLVTPAGTAISSMTFYNASSSAPQMWTRDYAEPMAVPSGTVFMSSVTPAVATSLNWIFNFDGYEK